MLSFAGCSSGGQAFSGGLAQRWPAPLPSEGDVSGSSGNKCLHSEPVRPLLRTVRPPSIELTASRCLATTRPPCLGFPHTRTWLCPIVGSLPGGHLCCTSCRFRVPERQLRLTRAGWWQCPRCALDAPTLSTGAQPHRSRRLLVPWLWARAAVTAWPGLPAPEGSEAAQYSLGPQFPS